VGRSVTYLARLALGAGYRQTRNGRGRASCRLWPVLDLEGTARPTGTTGHFPRGSRPDPQDVPRESQLGVHPAFTVNCSSSASTSARPVSANTGCAAPSRPLRPGAPFWRITSRRWSGSLFRKRLFVRSLVTAFEQDSSASGA